MIAVWKKTRGLASAVRRTAGWLAIMPAPAGMRGSHGIVGGASCGFASTPQPFPVLYTHGRGRRRRRARGSLVNSVSAPAARDPSREDQRASANGAGPGPRKQTKARQRQQPPPVTGFGALWRLRQFVLPHSLPMGGALFFLFATTIAGLLKPWPLKFVLDEILGSATLNENLLIVVASSVVAIALLEGLMKYVGAYLLNRVGATIVVDMRRALFDHINALSLRFHSRKATGDLLTRVTSDVKALRDVLTDHMAEVIQGMVFITGMVGVLLWLDWQLALVAIGSAPLLSLAVFHFTAAIQRYSREERKREGGVASVMHESLQAVRVTRAFNQEASAKKTFQAESEASVESGIAAAMTAERFSWLVDLVAAVVTAGVLGFGVYRVTEGAITAGTLVVFVSYVRDFYKPMRSAVKHANKISRATASAERVIELLDEEAVVDRPDARAVGKLEGPIVFTHVRLEYDPGRAALKNVDLTIPEGKVTAIVGPTGAGKTSLVSMIPRLYDPIRGSVSIGGTDIRDYTLASLRAQISVVFQESVLLRASVAENIAYGRRGATFDEVIAAAKAADAHDFIVALPSGYDTELGERGETLSGGQRQRIAIARAIIRDAPIVVLDEPLAGLDAAAAAAVMGALRRLMDGRTVIIITHHLSTAAEADFVVVMDEGRVAESGTHEQLARAEGVYRRLTQHAEQPLVELRA
jgi:ABC-type multidrug transport system fused ATPase/permease subunit